MRDCDGDALGHARLAHDRRPRCVPDSRPTATSAYVTGPGVAQYSVGAGGRLTPKDPPTVAAGTDPDGIAVSPDGTSVYAANLNSQDVSQYDVGPAGTLTPKRPPTVAVERAPQGIAISPAPAQPSSKDQCKNGGWRDFAGFENQGQCVRFVRQRAHQECVFIRAAHGRAAFRATYGSGRDGRHAMRNCVRRRM